MILIEDINNITMNEIILSLFNSLNDIDRIQDINQLIKKEHKHTIIIPIEDISVIKDIFINIINPKNSIISVGKNNRYGHPKESVLDILNNSKIYRTDIDGSIQIKFNINGYKIKVFSPQKR